MTMTFLSSSSALTLRCALEVTMITGTFERLPDGTLGQIAKNGRAYTNEVKHMARELQELRAKVARESATVMADPNGGICWTSP